MKTNRILLGMAACAFMLACSEEKAGVDSGKQDLLGEQAYLKVNITDAGSGPSFAASTRAENGDFEYGSTTEHKVATADFYFYDAAKTYVVKANVWAEGSKNEAKPDQNIEYMGNSVIVLKGLKQKNFPKYMVTVLNAPEGFEPGSSLTEMTEKLAGGFKNGANFIMSTTSFEQGTTPYCVTEITENNFKREPVEAENANPVQVYVERLAAKVTLKVDETNMPKVSGQTNVYELGMTVGGEDNEMLEKDPTTGATTLHVKFLGWGLNATANNSYMMKNIDTGWKDADLGFAWSVSSFHRSYWGKSYNYGKTDAKFPESSSEAAGMSYLSYIKANQLTNAIGDSDYCAENTNSSEIVSANFQSAVTSILLKAQILNAKDEELDLVVYNGALFTEDGYMKYVLNSLKNAEKLNAYYLSADNTYTRIDPSFVQLADEGDGKTYVQLTDEAKVEGTLKKPVGNDWVALTNEELTSLDNNLQAFNASNKAIAYKGGLMYYNIPIEHYNNNAITTDEETGEKVIPEAKYGIVRNHHYVVTINSLARLGKGIYDPDKVIVPGPSDDDELYSVGAEVNILSWKIVDQTVGL